MGKRDLPDMYAQAQRALSVIKKLSELA